MTNRGLLIPAFLLGLATAAASPGPASAQDAPPPPAPPTAHPSRFGEGAGPSVDGGLLRLLDAARTPGQSNAVAFDRGAPGAFERVSLRCRLRVLEGGDGGSFLLLSTADHGVRGPAPFLRSWVEPNLRGTFAVGIDVHDPKDEEPFSPRGNYRGMPEREVSLHWDGREIVKRVAPVEFRGEPADLSIVLEHVVGGAEATVVLAGAAVYDRFFIPGLLPYECRPAVGAGTRADAATEFDVRDLLFETGRPAAPVRPPLRVPVFDHVLTDGKHTSHEAEVVLPPPEWAFGRVILDLEIHDAGDAWDEWDRNGMVSVRDGDGVLRGIVPFITSYRTPCRWRVDVTPFRPWLAGRAVLEIAAGTTFYRNRGFRMSAALEFHHGTPALEPFRVIPLWNGAARHGPPENRFRDFFTPLAVPVDAEARAARALLFVTGHSQVGEFTPSRRTLVVSPDAADPSAGEERHESLLWKDDVYLNPNRPQFGTWKYSRAGWAPGDVVAPWVVDLGGRLRPGRTASFRYEPGPYEFPPGEEAPPAEEIAAAGQVVSSYLVLYREPGALVPAPRLLVRGVLEGGNAAKAGVREGDWLASYDGRPLASVEDLRTAIQAAEGAGRPASTVVLHRGAERLVLEVGPGKLGVSLAER